MEDVFFYNWECLVKFLNGCDLDEFLKPFFFFINLIVTELQ